MMGLNVLCWENTGQSSASEKKSCVAKSLLAALHHRRSSQAWLGSLAEVHGNKEMELEVNQEIPCWDKQASTPAPTLHWQILSAERTQRAQGGVLYLVGLHPVTPPARERGL